MEQAYDALEDGADEVGELRLLERGEKGLERVVERLVRLDRRPVVQVPLLEQAQQAHLRTDGLLAWQGCGDGVGGLDGREEAARGEEVAVSDDQVVDGRVVWQGVSD